MNGDTLSTIAKVAGAIAITLIVFGVIVWLALTFIFPGIGAIWSAGIDVAGAAVGALVVAILGAALAASGAVVLAAIAGWVTAEIVKSAARRALEKPNETIIGLGVAIGGVATAIGADELGIEAPTSYLIGGLAAAFAVIGELLIKRAGPRWRLPGWFLTVALPVFVLSLAVVPHLAADPVEAVSRVDLVTWAVIAAYVAVMIITAFLSRILPEPIIDGPHGRLRDGSTINEHR